MNDTLLPATLLGNLRKRHSHFASPQPGKVQSRTIIAAISLLIHLRRVAFPAFPRKFVFLNEASMAQFLDSSSRLLASSMASVQEDWYFSSALDVAMVRNMSWKQGKEGVIWRKMTVDVRLIWRNGCRRISLVTE